jgi:hypothetical protein
MRFKRYLKEQDNSTPPANGTVDGMGDMVDGTDGLPDGMDGMKDGKPSHKGRFFHRKFFVSYGPNKCIEGYVWSRKEGRCVKKKKKVGEAEHLLESKNIPGHRAQGEDVWEVLLEPQDTPPETDSRGNYIVYHGTILSTAKEIIKTKLVKQSSGWGTGITTTPWEAKGYAGMKRIDVGGLETGEKAAVLQIVIDKNWFHKQVIQREVGGHGKNEFLIRGDIVPKAIKKIKIWRTFP